MIVENIQKTEFNSYYQPYIDMIPRGTSLVDGHKKGKQQVLNFFNTIPEDKLSYRYQPDKWSVKEVFQHLIDTERIFMYRCLRIARRDTTELLGFEQNDYIDPSGANNKTIDKLLNEYETTKNYTIALLESFSDEDLSFIGNANGGNLTARAAAFILIGHEIWHTKVIKERYL